MSTQMTEAMKSATQIQREMVQWENRVETLKSEHDRLAKTRDALQAEIDKKTADYNVYLSQRELESKNEQKKILEEKNKFEQQKVEFQGVLAQFAKDRQALMEEKNAFESSSLHVKAQIDGVKGFIQAVQRAITLLGV